MKLKQKTLYASLVVALLFLISLPFWAINYTVTLNNGDDNKTINTKYYETHKLEPASKDYYDFLGWFDKNGKEYTEISHLTSDLTLEAKYEPIYWTIHFEYREGETEDSYPLELSYCAEKDVALPILEKEGYDFLGWEIDGYIEHSLAMPSYGDKIAKAIFKPTDYSLYLVTNGGVISGSFPSTYNIETEDSSLPSPNMLGHSFVAWYLDKELTIPFDSFKNHTGNLTLYAGYKKNQVIKKESPLEQGSQESQTVQNNISGPQITVGSYTAQIQDGDVYDYNGFKNIFDQPNLAGRTQNGAGVEYIADHNGDGFRESFLNDSLTITREDGSVDTYTKVSTHYVGYSNDDYSWTDSSGEDIWRKNGGDLLTQTCSDDGSGANFVFWKKN